MKCAAGAAWSAILLVGVATAAFPATAEREPSPSKGEPAQAAKSQAVKSLEAVFGKTLISIDGSTIEIIAAEGRIAREIVAPNGAVQRSNFIFINARLGTVADARDAARVTGVFRASDQEILIQYGDGSSEIVMPNAEGGITIEATSPKSPAYCTAWYPEGHVFTLDDRKAALLQYANRLGLGVSTEKAAGTPARSGCGSAAPSATAASSTLSGPAASPVPAAAPAPAALQPPVAVPAMEPAGADEKAASIEPPKEVAATPMVLPGIAEVTAMAARAAELPAAMAVAKAAELPATNAVDVRNSEIHLIDQPMEATPVVATAGMPNPGQQGASSCLSVDSHWGFRNKCGYSVQYAYCTMDGRNQLTACKDGFVGGSVAPNGFGVLVADQNLRSINENHDFRWVACQGGAGEVIARLDKSDPPVGRCVR
jgi:hypothetical protein